MSRLRIGWASPWNHHSAIAQSASEIAFELSRCGHEVTVLRTETGEALALTPRPAPGAISPLAECEESELRQAFDVIVAHVGDHYGFHGALPSRLRNVEVVGVFHDAFIGNLANGWAGGEMALRQLVCNTYGEDAWPEDQSFFSDLSDALRRRPMLEWLARRTIGAVAHAEHYAQRLRAACPGPVAVIPLAFTVPDLPPPPSSWDRMTIGIVGHANPNKRIDQVILAVGASPVLRHRCRIKVIGESALAERERLTSLAQATGVTPPEFTGWVTDDELRWKLRDVDVISCLRNPILEGASASLVLAQASGRPTLVTNHGSYAEVPLDTVLPCSPEHEARDVMRHLESLFENPELGRDIGQRAAALVMRRNTPATYSERLISLLEEVITQRPLLGARQQLIGTLTSFGLSPTDPSVERVDTVLANWRAKNQ